MMDEDTKISLSELDKALVLELPKEELLSVHRRTHQLVALDTMDFGKLRKAHDLLAEEITRRGMEHDSPLEKPGQKDDLPGLYLQPPHGFLIWTGRKKAVAKSVHFVKQHGDQMEGGRLILVSGKEAFGEVELGPPAEMNAVEFDRSEWFYQHRVKREEREAWWPDEKGLFVYPIQKFEGYDQPQPVEVPRGTQNWIKEVRFKEYSPNWEREQVAIQQALRLPKQIILTPRAVSLTGSMLYGEHEPRDVDLVLVGAEWRPEEEQFVVPLTPTFKEKLDRLFGKVFGAEPQYISEGSGASFDHLPLYQLALVRLPWLAVEHVSESEPEFADLAYDKDQKRGHSRAKCMWRECSAPPEVDVQWADGRGRAWFCLSHFEIWLREEESGQPIDDREIVRIWAVPEGEVPKKIKEHKRTHQVKVTRNLLNDIKKRLEKLTSKALSQSALERILRGSTQEVRRQAKRSFEEDEIIPGRVFVPLKPLRPAKERERQIVSAFYRFIKDQDYWPWYVSPKRDGARHTIHRKGDQILIYSDDGRENAERLPRLVKRLKDFGEGDWVIDTEIEYWKGGQHYPREAASGAIHSGEDEFLVVNILRLLHWGGRDLHREPFERVWELMRKLKADSTSSGRLYPDRDQRINVVPHLLARNLAELKKRVESLAYKPGVEGVVVKRADGVYPLDGDPREDEKVMLAKWHKSAAFTFVTLDRVETKTPGVYNYWYGIPLEGTDATQT